MRSKFRHILSSILGAIIYFLTHSPEPAPLKSTQPLSAQLVGDVNLETLKTGTWIVVTDKYNFEDSTVFELKAANYGVLVVNSMSSAKVAAVLGLDNPKGYVSVVDGVINNGQDIKIDAEVPIEKIIDYFVYYWAVGLKGAFKAPGSFIELAEMFGGSVFNLLVEVGQYFVG